MYISPLPKVLVVKSAPGITQEEPLVVFPEEKDEADAPLPLKILSE